MNVNVKVEQQKAPKKPKAPEKKKPNWIVKAIVLGLIALAISLLGFYLKGEPDGKINKGAFIENGEAAISGEKVNTGAVIENSEPPISGDKVK